MKEFTMSTTYRVRASVQAGMGKGRPGAGPLLISLQEGSEGTEGKAVTVDISGEPEETVLVSGYEVRYGKNQLLISITEERPLRPFRVSSPEAMVPAKIVYTGASGTFLGETERIARFGKNGEVMEICFFPTRIRLSGAGDIIGPGERGPKKTVPEPDGKTVKALEEERKAREKAEEALRQTARELEAKCEEARKAAEDKLAAEKKAAELKIMLEGSLDRRLRDEIRKAFEEGKVYTENLKKNLDEAEEEEIRLREKQDKLKEAEGKLEELREEQDNTEKKTKETEKEIERLKQKKEEQEKAGRTLEEIVLADLDALKNGREELMRRYQLDEETMALLESDPVLRAAGAAETMEEIRKQLESLEKKIGFLIRVREKINRDLVGSITSLGGGVVPAETETGGYHG